ncbi:MAG: hypothetical protein HOC70_15525 [Gammaproteobacteria bacterium]|jgi:uroporphyrin-III C-methyltransferase|nr:hypothetical protein [Gammaproteobacteria bacterium]MBT4494653.1 hypothetical protein [Gammaproteobacteria bacterium]
MSEITDKPADDKLDEAFEKLEKNQAQPSSSGFGGTLAIFLSLIAVGIATYPAYELYRQGVTENENPLQGEVDRLRRDYSKSLSRIDGLEARLGESDEIATTVREEMAALSEHTNADLEMLRRRVGTSSEDWLFAEVEYLVRMANQRVLMEKDSASALKLLSSADRIVGEAEGLTAHTLRQALAADIAALKAVDSPDIQGIYLELSALIGQVDGLKRSLPSFTVEVSGTETVADGGSILDRIAAQVSGAGSRLGHLVDFRRRDEEIKPILPPDQAYYVRQNLVLKLQIAQMALLESEVEAFSVAVSEARAWLKTHFDTDASSTAMEEALTRLEKTPVGLELPDISGSLNAARDMLADFHRSPSD